MRVKVDAFCNGPIKFTRSSHIMKTSRAKGLIDENSLDMQKQKYETAIKDASNSKDPLAPWIDYHKWVKQTYPNEKKEKLTILQNATKLFRDSKQYKQDNRYLRLWVLYVSIYYNLFNFSHYNF